MPCGRTCRCWTTWPTRCAGPAPPGPPRAGPPATVYAEPADLTVARLTGPVSVLAAPALGDALATVPVTSAPGASTTILVRPGWGRLGGDLPGVLDEIRFRGPHTDYHLTT